MFAGGGAPKPPAVFHEVLAELGIRIVHGWAMTECPMTCCNRPSNTDEQLANTDGRAVLGAEVIVVRPDGTRAAVGETGELRARGSMLFAGYADPALHAAAFDDEGYYRTGDLGMLRADGNVVVTGRTKDIIIRKGENVSAREIEDLLHLHQSVAEAAVIGVPDAERGELVCVVIASVAGAEPLTLADIREHCAAAGLARFKTPERVEHLTTLPRNATGKIMKEALRARYAAS
jgi:acyl-CoA synthetase (AMP-forming)/AMP-acid ligase II